MPRSAFHRGNGCLTGVLQWAISNGRPPAFVLGVGINGLSVVRNLGRHGVKVVGMDSSRSAGGWYSRYCRTVRLPDLAAHEQVWLDWLLAVGQRLSTPGILFPTGDPSVLFIARHEEALSRYFKWPLPDQALVEAILDKARQYHLVLRCGIPQPKAWVVKDPQEAERIKESLPYPCVFKPIYSHQGRQFFKEEKVLVIRSPKELLPVFQHVHALGLNGLIQELIPGGDDTLSELLTYIGREGQPLGIFTLRKLRQFPIYFGSGSLRISCWIPEVVSLGLQLLQEIRFRGLAGVEFKYDARDGQFKLIEINARTIGPGELAVGSGVELPWLAYQDLTGIPIQPVETFRQGLKWFSLERDLRAFWHYRRIGILNFRQWLRSIQGEKVYAFFAWDDPLPFLKQTIMFGASLVKAVSLRLRWYLVFGKGKHHIDSVWSRSIGS